MLSTKFGIYKAGQHANRLISFIVVRRKIRVAGSVEDMIKKKEEMRGSRLGKESLD